MDRLRRIIDGSRPFPGFDSGVDADGLAGYGQEPDRRQVISDQAAVFGRKLEWDSNFFGFPCGRIDHLFALGQGSQRFQAAVNALADLLAWFDNEGIRFLAAKVPGPDPILVQAFEHHGFYLTDATQSLHRSGGPLPETPTLPPEYRFEAKADPDEAARAFGRLFYDGRFHHDHRIPRETADRLWAQAVRSQAAGEAREALYLFHDDRPVGIAALTPAGPPDGRGCLFLFGIKDEYRGRGLGTPLLAEILRRHQNGYSAIDVETSTYNLPALRLYRSLGFEPGIVRVSLHGWR
jgi:RimJ/RimL family protein N-acetyltransferase